MSLSEKDFSLRERKFAKTKIALATAFIERMKTSKFSDISIKEVCASVEVSEGTFFNYFPQKIDVVFYYKQIVGLTISWKIRQEWDRRSPRELIELTFDLIADEISHPYLFYETISLFTAERKKAGRVGLTPAEKFYVNPESEGLDDIPEELLEETFLNLVRSAVSRGDLRPETRPEEVALTLMAILVGVPLVIQIEDFQHMKKYYRSQLSLLWKAIGA